MKKSPFAHRIKNGDLDILKEVLREAELHLDAQLSSAIAADQRAYTFAGAISAAAVLLVGASYNLVTANPPNFFLTYVALAVVAAFFISAWLAVVSARSIDFEFAGNEPCKWVADIEEGKSLTEALSEQCEHYDAMIENNSKTMKKNGDLFNISVYISLTSAGIAGLMFLYWIGTLNP